MSNFSKRFFVIALIGIISLSVCGVSYAAEGDNSLTGFFRRLFNYPGKAVQSTGEMTANTLNNTGEKVVAATGENTAEVLSGNLQETGNLVGDAAKGTLETTGQTASETVQIPVTSAEETKS